MRSRYSAFATADGAYLVKTIVQTQETAASLSTWAKSVTWLGLEVHERSAGTGSDSTGTVTFTARYLEDKREVSLNETSRFTRSASGAWQYLDGALKTAERAVERNDRCPCGSGKKFKACHG